MDNKDLLVDCLISALGLEWQDNGNLMADAVRDRCLAAMSSVLSVSIEEVLELIAQRVEEMQ